MIAIDGLNEEKFLASIDKMNKLNILKPEHYSSFTERKKFGDMKHKMVFIVSRHNVTIQFNKNGVGIFRYTKCHDGTVMYFVASHKAPNPDYRPGRDYTHHEFTSYCSRDEFYDYVMAYPVFFQWLLWNQI